MTPIKSQAPQPEPTTTYAAAYARLTALAAKLRVPGQAATVDTLAEDVRAARDAYQQCRSRLEAIRREVDEAIGPAEGAAAPLIG